MPGSCLLTCPLAYMVLSRFSVAQNRYGAQYQSPAFSRAKTWMT
jgi:hypothetical protein